MESFKTFSCQARNVPGWKRLIPAKLPNTLSGCPGIWLPIDVYKRQVFVTSAAMVLKLGIASVALTGSVLLIRGSIDVLTLFLFLLVASRL